MVAECDLLDNHLFCGLESNRTSSPPNPFILSFYSLDVRLVQRHQTGVDPQGDGGQVEVVKEHRQVVVKATAGMKVELQDTRRGEGETAGTARLVAEPQLQAEGELGPFDALLQVAALHWKETWGGKCRDLCQWRLDVWLMGQAVSQWVGNAQSYPCHHQADHWSSDMSKQVREETLICPFLRVVG